MDYKFADLIDVGKVQTLTDSFSEIVGTANAIIDLQGEIITGSGWQRACTDFHRANPQTCQRCIESDTVLAGRMLEGEPYAVYECANGLVDAAAPIMVGGEHVANFFIGQFLFEPPDKAFFRQQAAEFGFDEAAYLGAISEVPIVDRAKVPSIMEFLAQLAALLGEMGMTQLQQVEANRKLEQASQEIIAAQQQALLELSVPIIPLMDQIIVLPLVGSVDTLRARELMRTLLAGIGEHRAQFVILDVTGVPVMDTGVVGHLNKTIQAARLKGAHVIVTGLSDAVAETIVDLGIDWGEVETLSNLQTGLMVALQRMGVRLVKA